MHHPALQKCFLFRSLTPDQTDTAIQLMGGKTLSYEKGSMMLRIADKTARFWLVLEGFVHICLDEEDGNRVIMATVSPGETFGESLCFLGKEAPVFAEAKTNVKVMELCGDVFAKMPDTNFAFLLQQRFTAMLAKRTLEMNARIQILSKKTMRDKIFTMLAHFGGNPDAIPFPLPFDRSGMAFYLGVDRSALSRELSKLKEEGSLDFKKNTFIWSKR